MISRRTIRNGATEARVGSVLGSVPLVLLVAAALGEVVEAGRRRADARERLAGAATDSLETPRFSVPVPTGPSISRFAESVVEEQHFDRYTLAVEGCDSELPPVAGSYELVGTERGRLQAITDAQTAVDSVTAHSATHRCFESDGLVYGDSSQRRDLEQGCPRHPSVERGDRS